MEEPQSGAIQKKVSAGTLAGAVTIVLVWALKSGGIDVPAEAASGITTMITFITAYMVPNREA